MSAQLWDEQAERAVLGAIVVDNSRLDDVADTLEAEHFGRQHHALTYQAMLALHREAQPIDPLTLSAKLEQVGQIDTVTRSFLYQLGDGVPKGSHILAYAKVVRDKWTLRCLRDHGRRILAQAEADAASAADLLEQAEQEIYRLTQRAVKTDWVSAEELSAELYPVIEQLTVERRAVTGLPSGFQNLDFMTRGFQGGDLILLGARPSMGKTAFALQLAMSAAKTTPVAFFSIEMARQPIGLRGVIAAAKVDGFRFLSGFLSEADHYRVGEGLADFGALSLYIDESPTLSPLHARSKIRRLSARAGKIGLVVVDYLQLMAPMPDDRRENRTNQVAGISRMLKLLARECGAPFLVLSQLNRGLERSGDKRPQLSDLRESGALEQDADVVLFLHRPEVYEPDKVELHGMAEVIVGKQRNGPTGTAHLTWRAPQMRFENRANA